MSLAKHSPPGFVKDLDDSNLQAWSDMISSFMLTDLLSPELTPQFYDATKVTEKGAQNAKVTWIGFPRKIKLRGHTNDQERWYLADSERQLQDEYLEWSVQRNNEGKITKLVFCNEGPEYFEFLGEKQPDTLLKLYQDLNPGFGIQSGDLFDEKGKYNPMNKWNNSTKTGTIMHLIQGANYLSAEADLGGRATVIRKDSNGNVITDMDQLIRCSGYGNPDRNSDPHIGIAVNNVARGDKADLSNANQVTIADPVGLYIDSVDWGMVDPPSGHEDDDPQDFWKWTRGAKGNYMRGEFEVPPGKGYVVGDMLVNGQPLNYGAQLADIIRVSITARYFPLGYTPKPRFCWEPPQEEDEVKTGSGDTGSKLASRKTSSRVTRRGDGM